MCVKQQMDQRIFKQNKDNMKQISTFHPVNTIFLESFKLTLQHAHGICICVQNFLINSIGL